MPTGVPVWMLLMSRDYLSSFMKIKVCGALLAECVVGVMALIAATSLHPEDYFAINSSAQAGPVTLAVGVTDIFIRVPWFGRQASYLLQFVIMFEAVFILTAVDSGTAWRAICYRTSLAICGCR